MTHQYTKLADALEDGALGFKVYAATYREAARILRAAAVDVQGLMALARKFAIAEAECTVLCTSKTGKQSPEYERADKEYEVVQDALESALRLALAAREEPPDTQGSAFGQITREHAHSLWDAVSSIEWRNGAPVHVNYAYALLRRFGKPAPTSETAWCKALSPARGIGSLTATKAAATKAGCSSSGLANSSNPKPRPIVVRVPRAKSMALSEEIEVPDGL